MYHRHHTMDQQIGQQTRKGQKMRKNKIDFTLIPDREKAERLTDEYAKREAIKLTERTLQEKLNLNYRYFRFFARGKEVAISVGYKIFNEGKSVAYAITFQSDKDQFSRKDARKYINKRWDKNKVVEFFHTINPRQVDTLIACHYNSRANTPSEYGVEGIPKYLNKIPIWCA